MHISRRFGLSAALAAFAFPQFVHAAGDRILLDVTGNVAGEGVQFSRQMLRELDWREIETFTSFTDGPQRFAGPTLSSVLAAVGANGATVRATAINDYTISFPVTDAQDHDVLLAMEHNGEEMRVRDKGPIWVVYPLDEEAAKTQVFDDKMIWQLNRLVIE